MVSLVSNEALPDLNPVKWCTRQKKKNMLTFFECCNQIQPMEVHLRLIKHKTLDFSQSETLMLKIFLKQLAEYQSPMTFSEYKSRSYVLLSLYKVLIAYRGNANKHFQDLFFFLHYTVL